MEEIDFSYAAGKRITSVLIYTSDGFLFQKKRSLKDSTLVYECYTKECKVKIHLLNGICTRSSDVVHSHSDHIALYNQFRSEFLVKTRAQSNPDLSIRALVAGQIGNVAAESPESPFRRMRSSLYHNRNIKLPLNPRSFQASLIYIQNSYITTLLSKMSESGKIYHHIHSDDETIFVILASATIMQRLPDSRHAVISSSCRVVPPNSSFKVLLTVSIVKMKETFPCIYVLMTDREVSSYERVIGHIESKWHLNISKAWIDYERDLRNVIKRTYPNIDVKGFWYQFCVAVRSKCKTFNNFFEHLWTDSPSCVLYHQYLCLPLLPRSEIGSGFQYLKEKSATTGYVGFEQMNDFFETVWMGREHPDNFAVEMEYFGEQCTLNVNENLKQKWHSPDAVHSLIDLLKLIEGEIIETNGKFDSDTVRKPFSTRQIHFIKKQFNDFRMSDTKDIAGYLRKLTFIDNNGSVKGWDNYTFGDEEEFAVDNDDAYDQQVQQVEAVHVEADEPVVNERNRCIVCLTNDRVIMLEPCNHFMYCRDCVDTLMMPRTDSQGRAVVPTCPYCRCAIRDKRVVYQ